MISSGLHADAATLSRHVVERGIMPKDADWREVTAEEAETIAAPTAV